MILVNNFVQVMGQQYVATADCLKQSKTVLQKIGFDDNEKSTLESVGFDFATFNDLKQQYAADKSVVDDLKRAAPLFMYLKQRRADTDAVIVAVAFDGQVYLNKNVDNDLGVGAEATRYKYMAWINAFISTFGATDNGLSWFDGAPFICTQSALDNRKNSTPKQSEDCFDW